MSVYSNYTPAAVSPCPEHSIPAGCLRHTLDTWCCELVMPYIGPPGWPHPVSPTPTTKPLDICRRNKVI
jgi:hypothetical protein